MVTLSLVIGHRPGREPACVRLAPPQAAPRYGEGVSTVPDRELYRRCLAKIKTLDIPEPFSLDEFCTRLKRQRDRPVRLVPIVARLDSPCGLWVGLADADYIFYERATTPLHRRHIILHEIGHLLFDHRGGPWLDDDLTRLLMPDLDPALIRAMLGRTIYTEIEELEAETVASLILERASEPAPPLPHLEPALAAVISRVESTFGPTP